MCHMTRSQLVKVVGGLIGVLAQARTGGLDTRKRLGLGIFWAPAHTRTGGLDTQMPEQQRACGSRMRSRPAKEREGGADGWQVPSVIAQ